LLWLETGESRSCMSSTSTLFAARSAAVGIIDQTPRRKLKKKVALQTDLCQLGSKRNVKWEKGRGGKTYAMSTVAAKVPFAMRQ
jgi:hypothetical protein